MTTMTISGGVEHTLHRYIDTCLNERKPKDITLAVAISVILHIAVLFGVVAPWETRAPAQSSPQMQTISVSLITLSDAPTDREDTSKEIVRSEPAKPSKADTPLNTAQATPAITRTGDIAVKQAEAAHAEAPYAPIAQEQKQPPSQATQSTALPETEKPSGSAATKAGGAAVPGSVVSEAKTEGTEDGDRLVNDALLAYKRALWQELGKARKYPAAARRLGYSGRVLIQLNLVNGQASSAVTGNSNYEELDEMGLRMVEYAIRNTRVPDALKSVTTNFNVPIVFQLID